MSTFSPVPVVATGDWITAGWVNTYIGDNMSALWVGTSAGDIDYYISATEKARLAKPGVDSVLKNTSAGTPSWMPISNLGGLHASGLAIFNPDTQVFSSATWTDITGATMDLTLSVACTVIVLATVTGFNATSGRFFFVRASVDGNVDANHMYGANGGQSRNESLPYIWLRAGVPAGTRTVKLQCRNDTDPNTVTRGKLIALAFAE